MVSVAVRGIVEKFGKTVYDTGPGAFPPSGYTCAQAAADDAVHRQALVDTVIVPVTPADGTAGADEGEIVPLHAPAAELTTVVASGRVFAASVFPTRSRA